MSANLYIKRPCGFSIKKFFGKKTIIESLWRGWRDSSGLHGRLSWNKRSRLVREINPAHLSIMDGRNPTEFEISGEERRRRLSLRKNVVQIDHEVSFCLLTEPHSGALETIYRKFGLSQFEVLGTVFRGYQGQRYAILLRRCNPEEWVAGYLSLEYPRGEGFPALVLKAK